MVWQQSKMEMEQAQNDVRGRSLKTEMMTAQTQSNPNPRNVSID